MIGIKTNNGFLDLGENFQIQIDLVSPLFSFEVGYGSTSLKFSIPNSPNNRKLLNQADMVLNTTKTSTVDVYIWLGGTPWRSALLNVVESGPTFQVSLDISESKIAALFDSMSMQDFEYVGLKTIPGSGSFNDLSEAMIVHANYVATGIIDTDYFFFPIRDDNMHETSDTLSFPTVYINYYRDDTFYDRTTYQTDHIFTTIQNLIPFPKLQNVIQFNFNEIGYKVEDTIFTTDPELDTLCIYNNRTLNRNRSVFKNWLDISQHVPDVTAREFYQGLNRLFNLALIVDENTQKVKLLDKASLVGDKSQTDWRSKCISYSITNNYSLNLSLFSEQDSDDRLLGNIQNPEPEEEIAGEVYNYADLPIGVDGLVYYVGERNAVYRYSSTSATWEFFSWKAYPEIIGTGETQRWSNISTTMMTRDTWYDTNIWRVPYVDQYLTGVNPQNNLEKWPFSPRLLFYRGMSAGSPSYPVGSADDIDGAHNYSLYWHGENGLFEKWHKPWTDMIGAAMPVTYYLLLNVNDLSNIDWTKKVRVRVKEGTAWGYIQKLTVTFTRQGVNPVKAELLIV